jgi:hypothetical protein
MIQELMYKRIFLSLVLLLCWTPLWCQVEPSASGGQGSTSDDSLMTLPPQESGAFYPSSVGSQDRANILSGGVIVSAGYDDNLLTDETGHPVGAETYMIFPNIVVAEQTSRARGSLAYSPGFIFYDPTTVLNSLNQNVNANFQYRLTPHTTIGLQEVFQQNSTVFSQPYTFSGTTISGSAESGSPIVILPYAGQRTDSTQAHIGYQFSRSSMIGGSGYFSSFNYSNLALEQETGLDNSDSGGGSAFYSHRLTRSQYMGFTYRYSISDSSPVSYTSKNQFVSFNYSVNFERVFSISLTGGPEYSTSTSPGIVPTHSWSPSGAVSLGWHKPRANVALSYSRAVTSGWGLIGAYTADSASTSIQYQFARKLFGNLSGNYANTKNATSLSVPSSQVGHLLFGRAALQYRISEHLSAVAEYTRLHENYAELTANNPNADRVSVSLNFAFSRPLGR